MRLETVHYFTDNEEEQVTKLVQAGARPNVAKVLVFLAVNQHATAAEIERGAGMRQPDVSNALKSQCRLGWIQDHKRSSSNAGRTVRLYELVKSLPEIMDAIAEERRQKELTKQLALVRKLKGLSMESASPPDARAS